MRLSIERIPKLTKSTLIFNESGECTTEIQEYIAFETVISCTLGRWSKIWKWRKHEKD